MKRSKLLRKTPIRRKRKTPRRSARQRDTEYMLRVKQLPCCAETPAACRFGSEHVHAHHAGKRAAGRKADDDTTIPLCVVHHKFWHDSIGRFEGWTKAERRSWAEARIAETRARLKGPAGAYSELEF